MTPADSASLPDFSRMALVFDRYLPLIEPVGTAVLRYLPPLTEGAHVLDVACGTGEPGLTLARRSRAVNLLGIDTAAGMIEVARAKAAQEELRNARFEVMAAESLSCADESIDAVISRFGILMFGDTAASVRQMARALRRGGSYSLAVVDDTSKSPVVRAVVAALRPLVESDLLTVFDRLEGAMAADRLHAAGLTDVHSTDFEWDYDFTDSDALWAFTSGSGVFGRPFAVLREREKAQVRATVTRSLEPYRRADGSYRIPHTCRIHWGRR